MNDDTAWRDIRECPDDFDRPGGPRTWRLRCNLPIQSGRTYVVSGADGHPDALPWPFVTTGRRTIGNNTGWAETNTNRELHPTDFAPLAE